MQYGCSKPTGPWRFSVQVPQEPRCPGCAEFLQPCVVEFRDGWAWCPVCIAMGLHCEPWIGAVLGGDSMCECSRVVNGLRFYTPDVCNDDAKTAYEQYEQIEGRKVLELAAPERDGVYVLTPSGEHLLADLDVGELLQVESDLKRFRNRKVPLAAAVLAADPVLLPPH